MGKSGNLLDLVGSCSESAEDCADIGALLHRNNPKLILFIDPDEEGLLVVVEDTSALWPVPVKTACVKEPVALLEKEVVCDQLLPLGFGQGV